MPKSMDTAGLALSAAQTLFSAIQTVLAIVGSPELKQLFSKEGYLSELESLESTVSAVKAVLLDAQSKDEQQLSHSARDSIEKLKDAVYDADDLLDEFSTLIKQEHQLAMEGNKKFLRKVRALFSRFKKHKIAQSMSQEIKKIRDKLDQIANDAKFGIIKVDRQPIRKREETYSYVNDDENRIIGRDDDKRRVVDMLLDPNIPGDFRVLAIVGMGGLGKTTLAKLVYGDGRIQTEFHNRRFWVCVSDQDHNKFNSKAILARIYELATDERNIDHLNLDCLVQKLRKILDQNKYFLVLDDVWTEDHAVCNELIDILIGPGRMAKRGSRIVVTTRSKRTSTVMRCSHPYELKGLSDENSWLLFKITSGIEEANNHDLVEIGKEIVKKCANVPLAIKVIGSFLYGQNEDIWRLIQQHGLSATPEDHDNSIMPILKFSYYHLSPSLKSCFSYCALFPKDFKIEKKKLLSLWMAHDYVEDKSQDREAVAEYYFNILVQRCFFQDVHGDDEKRVTFKIHDLMHDMAQEVAGKEIFVANSVTTDLDKKIRHLYDSAPFSRKKGLITTAKIRSYVKDGRPAVGNIQFPISKLVANWRSLRALDLSQLNMTSLPYDIGELSHLRWLDLSGSEQLKTLPKSFTKLINLQHLDLTGCHKLKELPKDFNKLVKLRTLYVPYNEYKNGLKYMPLGMEKMTCLMKLNKFVVGQRKFRMKQERPEDLRAPRSLRGSLEICICPNYKHGKECGEGGGYLSNTEHLKSISIKWPSRAYEEERAGNHEDIFKDLQPHSNLNELVIMFYVGGRFPRWAIEDGLTTSLPNLVKIVLTKCDGLKELPWLGKLQHLKTLRLYGLKNLEYMENETRGTSSGIGTSNEGAAATATTSCSSSTVDITKSSIFFPSLEEFVLYDLPRLKGWWKGSYSSVSGMRDDERVNNNSSSQIAGDHRLLSFPSLSVVTIQHCSNLRSMPLGPAVETLEFSDYDSYLMIFQEIHDPTNRKIRTNNVSYLNSLPTVDFKCHMEIKEDKEVESLSEVDEEVFHSCLSSLQCLTIAECGKLRSISMGLQHLTALESLTLFNLPKLRFDVGTDNGMPWRCIAQCLRSLDLALLNVVDLPKGMRYLTALQSLVISCCPLKDLPEWIGCLSSLQNLNIYRCRLKSLPEGMRKLTSLRQLGISSFDLVLKRSCENPDGNNWPKIQHIPDVSIITLPNSPFDSDPDSCSDSDYSDYESAASISSLQLNHDHSQ